MDISYILYNTIIYGGIAFIFSQRYATQKVINLSIGWYMVACWYVLYDLMMYWFSWKTWGMLLFVILSYISMHALCLYGAKDVRSRNIVGIIASLWFLLLVDNMLWLVYGPWSVSVSWIDMSVASLFFIIVCAQILISYMYRYTFWWTATKSIDEHERVWESIWIDRSLYQCWVYGITFLLLVWLSFLVLAEASMQPSDAVFYLIKWMWITVFVWYKNPQRLLLGALIYVLVEYCLFVVWWVSILYKESLMLVCILIVLLVKPRWIFSSSMRNL